MTNQMKDRLPRLLGYLGLLPILFSTTLIFCDSNHLMLWRNMLLTYAVVILSFLGGAPLGLCDEPRKPCN